MDLVNKTYVRGVLRVGFEISGSDAVVHTEGADAPTEETLLLGVATLTPASIKKWIRISDEALDLGGQEFLDYIYDEVTYKIAKAAQKQLLDLIIAAPAGSIPTAAGVPVVQGAPTDLAIISEALSWLSDEAANPVVVMNRRTHAEFMSAIVANNFMFDPFDGLDVYYDNSLKAYNAASAGDTWLIVGDFGVGAQANFPNGEDIRIKFDDLTEAEADLVKVVGREYVGLGVVAPNAFAKVTKSA
jgi:HK97 family phage major capsid protein